MDIVNLNAMSSNDPDDPGLLEDFPSKSEVEANSLQDTMDEDFEVRNTKNESECMNETTNNSNNGFIISDCSDIISNSSANRHKHQMVGVTADIARSEFPSDKSGLPNELNISREEKSMENNEDIETIPNDIKVVENRNGTTLGDEVNNVQSSFEKDAMIPFSSSNDLQKLQSDDLSKNSTESFMPCMDIIYEYSFSMRENGDHIAKIGDLSVSDSDFYSYIERTTQIPNSILLFNSNSDLTPLRTYLSKFVFIPDYEPAPELDVDFPRSGRHNDMDLVEEKEYEDEDDSSATTLVVENNEKENTDDRSKSFTNSIQKNRNCGKLAAFPFTDLPPYPTICSDEKNTYFSTSSIKGNSRPNSSITIQSKSTMTLEVEMEKETAVKEDDDEIKEDTLESLLEGVNAVSKHDAIKRLSFNSEKKNNETKKTNNEEKQIATTPMSGSKAGFDSDEIDDELKQLEDNSMSETQLETLSDNTKSDETGKGDDPSAKTPETNILPPDDDKTYATENANTADNDDSYEYDSKHEQEKSEYETQEIRTKEDREQEQDEDDFVERYDVAVPPLRDIVVKTVSKSGSDNKLRKSSSDFDNRSAASSVTTRSSAASSKRQQGSRRKRHNKNRTPKASFTADSPYFSAYVDKEVQLLSSLSNTLEDIIKRARTFGECGAAMAEATRNLSVSCKLEQPSKKYNERTGDLEQDLYEKEREKQFQRERRESVGEEMATSLRLMGDVLDEIADAQIKMCESLVASLCLPLENFVATELMETTSLKNEAEQVTQAAESSFAKYLHGRHSDRISAEVSAEASTNSNVGSTTSDKTNSGSSALAMGNNSILSLSSQIGRLSGWGSKISNSVISQPSGAEVVDMDVKRLNGNIVVGSNSGNAGRGGEKDPLILQAIAAANLRQNLQQIRLSQANAELKRFQLLRKIDSLRTRRNFELGESALASLHGIRAYFHHCSDLTQGLSPKLHALQSNQSVSRQKHESQQHPWESRETGLTVAISKVGVAASDAGVIVDALTKGQDPNRVKLLAEMQPKKLVDVEEQVELWELPRHLAESSLYQRDPTPGVIVEGWLYKKNSNRMSLSPWSRQWFILDKTGVYYLRGVSANNMERVRVCEIVLCTVRETNEKTKGVQGLRYCFEIITPNSRPYMLQACGPKDYRLWVDGIRSCIENQLSHGVMDRGDPSSDPSTAKVKMRHNQKSSKHSRKKSLSNTIKEIRRQKKREPGVKFTNDFDPQFYDPDADYYPDDMTMNTESVNESHGKGSSKNPLVRKVLKANKTCADCNAPNPDWASLNIGTMLCIECSGVHRSLGVHLSKVRSLTLDDISKVEALVLLSLGNKRVNSIWEAGISLQKGWERPKSTDSRKVKEDWIKSKYMWKGFIEYNSEDGREWNEREKKFSKIVYEAAKHANIFGIAEGLAKGGSLEWKNDEEGGKTALHICATSTEPVVTDTKSTMVSSLQQKYDESMNLEDLESLVGDGGEDNRSAQVRSSTLERIKCAELLIQNGAKIDAKDNQEQNVLDCALLENAQREMIEYLASKVNLSK